MVSEKRALNSRALREVVTHAPELIKETLYILTHPSFPLAEPEIQPTQHPVDVIEPAFLECWRWTLEARCPTASAPLPHPLHALDWAYTSPDWQRMTSRLLQDWCDMRAQYLQDPQFTPAQLQAQLLFWQHVTTPGQRRLTTPPERRVQELRALLDLNTRAAPVESVVPRPKIEDVQIEGVPVFVRLATARKLEWEWRLTLTLAFLAARALTLQNGREDIPCVRLLHARMGHSQQIERDALIPPEALDNLAQNVGFQLLNLSWSAFNTRRLHQTLTTLPPKQRHPILAMHIVNVHTKRLRASLDEARRNGQSSQVTQLQRDIAYHYDIKARAARVLLERSQLEPLGVDQGKLLVRGTTPLGHKYLHLPLPEFEHFNLKGPETSTRTIQRGALEAAQQVGEHYDVAYAVQELMVLIATWKRFS